MQTSVPIVPTTAELLKIVEEYCKGKNGAEHLMFAVAMADAYYENTLKVRCNQGVLSFEKLEAIRKLLERCKDVVVRLGAYGVKTDDPERADRGLHEVAELLIKESVGALRPLCSS